VKAMDEWNAIDILLAEDNDPEAELTVLALRKIGVINKLLRVCDGVEALAFIFREGKFAERDHALPKLILLDLMMPRAGGIAVLSQLRERAATKNIPVGILTASAEHSDFFDSQEMLVWDYLIKPVSPEALFELASQSGLTIVQPAASP
jgi:two-component system response regulator